ncbi:MAG TPA: beta-ketoacyl-ACP synthase III [Verrucomicrobiales bacterium]|nr:beta-ketoacyl-ACP synthase III [Verrucomicrobiales bacterium]
MSHSSPDTVPCVMKIAGTGSYVPDRVLTNADLEKIVETTDDWIVSRTGIKERRIAAPDEATSHMATKAAQRAIEAAGIAVEDIDLIIVATISPDTFFPSTACHVQRNLGATKAVAFDVSAACAGFLYAMQIARHFINSGNRRTALIIGADKLSGIVNWKDRNTCVLFGDGAGAAILTSKDPGDNDPSGLLSSIMASDGRLTDILSVPGGGSAIPITPENADQRLNTIHMQGREVFKAAVKHTLEACETAIERAGLTAQDISLIIPHQANIRIVDAIRERLKLPPERAFLNLHKYGNTSGAAIAIALDEAARSGAMKTGDNVLLVAFGAGFAWAASVIRW